MTTTPGEGCPSEEILRRRLQGASDLPLAGWLDEHVEHCLDCQSRLDEFSRQEWLGPDGLPSLPDRAGIVEADEAAFIRRMIRELPHPGNSLDPAAHTVPVTPLCQIPGFEQLQLVAQGGSGEVYRGWQPELNRWVALKTLPPTRSPERKARVIREARLLGRLQHPHIVRIHSVGELQGQPYLVMEWIRGGTLQDRIRQGPLPIREAARLGWEVATALEVVHAAGIVHRDLKPANVLLEPIQPAGEDSGPEIGHAKLTDFSIAFETDEHDRLSQTGMVLGTPGYMAPEQTGLSNHPAAVGPPADIYGAGAVLYALLTGRVPHEGDTSLTVLRRVATMEPVAPRTLRHAIPPDLETIVQKCLRTDPQRRYRSAGDLADDLRRYLDGRPILARPYSPGERLWIWGRRHAALVLALGLLAAVAALTATVTWHQQRQQTLLSAKLAQRIDEAEQASSAAHAYRTENLRSRWQMLEQMTQKAGIQLREDVLAPEQERGLVETVRRHLANQLDDRQGFAGEFSLEFAELIDRWTALEEQHGFVSQALADGDLLDRLAPHLGNSWESQRLFHQRDLRRVRVLDGLRRFPEAGTWLERLLEAEMPPGNREQAARVMQAAATHARLLLETGQSAESQRWIQRVREPLQRAVTQTPDDLPLAVTLLELRLLELKLLSAEPLAVQINKREDEWLAILRTAFGRHRGRVEATAFEQVRLAQRLTGLVDADRPRLTRATLEVWREAIRDLAGDLQQARQHEAELVVQQVAWETESIRFAGIPGGGLIDSSGKGAPGLEQAAEYLGRHPDDVPTRQRLAEWLVRRARLHHDRLPLLSLDFARRTIDLLTPVGGTWRLAAGGRAILSDAYQQAASALYALGRLEEARQALEWGLSHSREEHRALMLRDLVRVQLALGDLSAAQATTDKIPNPQVQDEARSWLRKTASPTPLNP